MHLRIYLWLSCVVLAGYVRATEHFDLPVNWASLERLAQVSSTRKLSIRPTDAKEIDCVQLELYRDARARGAGAGCKAALSLAQFVGAESGFTLDKHSHTLALVCRHLVAVLAFDTRERLMQWQVKVQTALGASRQYLVLVTSRGRARGPARLHVAPRALAALTAGVPPRLAALWEIPHLRRYGVVEGRFCFEGGSLCGKGEGLHVLVTERAHDIARDFERAARGHLEPRSDRADASRTGAESPESYRPDTRLSELSAAARPRDLPAALCDAPDMSRDASHNTLHDALGPGDAVSVRGVEAGTPSAALQRCRSCMSKLGALSRSSTAALTPGATHFSPAWTMEAVPEPSEAVAPSECLCAAPPARPPKPPRLDPTPVRHPSIPSPAQTCACSHAAGLDDVGASRVGPYENYDVPKLPSTEIDGEYYDTPRRLKECLGDELFRVTRSSTPNALVLQKPCGCLLKFGRRRREPTVIDSEESLEPTNCPCRRVTDWANGWIGLPSRRRNTASSEPSAPDAAPAGDRNALYATIDVSRKTRRSAGPPRPPEEPRRLDIDDGPFADYENLSFALSLEHYENAKDVLRRVGVTQAEIDAIGANLRPFIRRHPHPLPLPLPAEAGAAALCARCGHAPRARDEYLLMGPARVPAVLHEAAGYTPMSPAGAFRSLRHPARGVAPPDEKSASNPALSASPAPPAPPPAPPAAPRVELRKRSRSADSSRFLDDVEEFSGGAGSVSSLETLRGAEPPPSPLPPPAAPPARCRDSSSSNDSGVSSCSRRRPARRARSHEPPAPRVREDNKSASAEAEVPVICTRPPRGVVDTHSTSSGASDMSDYIETLSICSSHSSTDTPITMRQCAAACRHATSTLRPRSGAEYRADLRRAGAGPAPPAPPHAHLYTNLP